MMSTEKELTDVTSSVKDREKRIRELGKAVATKGQLEPFLFHAKIFCSITILLGLDVIKCL